MDLSHEKIELIELLLKVQDAHLIEYIKKLIKQEGVDSEYTLTKKQKEELDTRIDKYSSGKGKVYTWDEVKMRTKRTSA
jgi:putative addiction module component (TIGR02574 family)